MKQKQIGVSLSPLIQETIEEVAKREGRSVSSIAADAITQYLSPYLAQKRAMTAKAKTSIFTGLKKDELIHSIQKSA